MSNFLCNKKAIRSREWLFYYRNLLKTNFTDSHDFNANQIWIGGNFEVTLTFKYLSHVDTVTFPQNGKNYFFLLLLPEELLFFAEETVFLPFPPEEAALLLLELPFFRVLPLFCEEVLF